jgi:23S rRNA pseudouridine2605 synthase
MQLFFIKINLTMRISTVGSAISKLLSPNAVKGRVLAVQLRLSWKQPCSSWKYFSTASPSPSHDEKPSSEALRLSKLLSQHASNLVMSRREAERLIKSGDVTVAGQVVTVPQMLVKLQDLNNSVIQVEGKPVRFVSKTSDGVTPTKLTLNQQQKTRTWLVHKLPNEVVSEFDPQGRPSMLQRLVRGGVGKSGQTRLHLKPIGRLDMSTEGLILVTNDGQYAREMELPTSKLHRTYRVRAHGILSDYKLGRIRKGITIEGIRYAPMKVHVESKKQTKSTNKWLEVTCCEGKNRMIRNVFTHLGCK